MGDRLSSTVTTLPAQASGDDPVGLVDYLRVLQLRWRLVLAGTLTCGAVALGLGWLTPRTYEASAIVAVRPTTAGEQPTPVALASLRKRIENRSVAAEVIRELGLDKEPHRLSAGRFVEDHLQVEEIRNTNLLQLSVRLREPDLAARVANRFAETAADLNRRLTQQENESAGDFVKVQLDEARGRLVRLEAEILKYRRQAQIDLLREDAEIALEQRKRLVSLGVEIEAEKAGLSRAEEQLAKQGQFIDLKPQQTDPREELINPVHTSLAQQVADSRTKLSALERERQQLAERKPSRSQAAYLNALYEREAGLARLETEYSLATAVYRDLWTRYEQTRIQAASRSLEFHIVDRALRPDRAASPRMMLNLGMGLALGFFGCVLGVFVIASASRMS